MTKKRKAAKMAMTKERLEEAKNLCDMLTELGNRGDVYGGVPCAALAMRELIAEVERLQEIEACQAVEPRSIVDQAIDQARGRSQRSS